MSFSCHYSPNYGAFYAICLILNVTHEPKGFVNAVAIPQMCGGI